MKRGIVLTLAGAALATAGIMWLYSRSKDLNFVSTEEDSPGWWVKREDKNGWYHVWEDQNNKNIYRTTDKGTEVYHDGKWKLTHFQ